VEFCCHTCQGKRLLLIHTEPISSNFLSYRRQNHLELLTEYYHVGVIDKSNILLYENNLTRTQIENIVRAYNAKSGLIIRNTIIDYPSIERFDIYVTESKITDDGNTFIIRDRDPSEDQGMRLPYGWDAARCDGKDITREIINELSEKEKNNPEESGLKNTRYWLTHLVIPILVIVLGAAITGNLMSTKNVVLINAPPNLYNEGYNPFLGLWKTDSSGSGSYISFPQMNITRDGNDLVWVELFQGCTEKQCSLAKLKADKQFNKINVHYTSNDTDISVTLWLSEGQLRSDITGKVAYSNDTSQSFQLMGDGYQRVTIKNASNIIS